MAKCVDPDKTAHYEPSHLDLHCLHRYWFCSAGLKRFIMKLTDSKQVIYFNLKGTSDTFANSNDPDHMKKKKKKIQPYQGLLYAVIFYSTQ